MSDPLYSDSDFSAGNAQDPIAGLQETPVNEFQHSSTVATTNKLGHVKGGGNITIDPDGTIRAPELFASSWNNITGKPETFPPSSHNQDWSTIDNKPTAFPPTAHYHYHHVESSEVSGIINIATNCRKVLTKTLTNSNSITITPTAPVTMNETCDAEIYFNTGATKPNIVFTAPAGYTFVWKIPMLADIKINAKYNFLFTFVNSSRIDVYWEAV